MSWDFRCGRDRVLLDVASGGGVVVLLKRVLFLATLVLLATLGACEWLTGRAVREWSEEVALRDGRTITIQRHVEFDYSNSLAGDAYSSKERKSTLAFRGDLATLPLWDFPLVPLVLYEDPDSSEWVIVATTDNCEVWDVRGRPQPPYWEFRLKGSQWTEVMITDASFGQATNLFIGYQSGLPAKKITVGLTEAYVRRTLVADIYRSIRSDGRSGCGGV